MRVGGYLDGTDEFNGQGITIPSLMQQVDILPSIPQGMSLVFSKAEADCIAF